MHSIARQRLLGLINKNFFQFIVPIYADIALLMYAIPTLDYGHVIWEPFKGCMMIL